MDLTWSRRLSRILVAVATLVGALGLATLQASASPAGNGGPGVAVDDPPIVVGSGWQRFTWPGGGQPFDLEGPFTYNSATTTVLSVTDAFCAGDQFRIFDNGVLIGDTSAVPVDNTCSAPFITNPDVAFTHPAYSHGFFALSPGAHAITIQAIVNPFGAGAAFLRVDGPGFICAAITTRPPGSIQAVAGQPTLGTANADVIWGSPGDDKIAGLQANDVIFGIGGNDQLSGDDGDDVICGGADNDKITGGAGADFLDGGTGNDQISGSAGDDVLIGGTGADQLVGGDGTDTCTTGGDAGDAKALCEP